MCSAARVTAVLVVVTWGCWSPRWPLPRAEGSTPGPSCPLRHREREPPSASCRPRACSSSPSPATRASPRWARRSAIRSAPSRSAGPSCSGHEGEAPRRDSVSRRSRGRWDAAGRAGGRRAGVPRRGPRATGQHSGSMDLWQQIALAEHGEVYARPTPTASTRCGPQGTTSTVRCSCSSGWSRPRRECWTPAAAPPELVLGGPGAPGRSRAGGTVRPGGGRGERHPPAGARDAVEGRGRPRVAAAQGASLVCGSGLDADHLPVGCPLLGWRTWRRPWGPPGCGRPVAGPPGRRRTPSHPAR